MNVAKWLIPVLPVVALVGCSSSGSPPVKKRQPPIDVHGRVVLTDADSTFNALLTGTTGCAGVGGYSDLTEGASVVISDDAGKTLTITRLGPGTVTAKATGISHDCNFPFTATVPAGEGFYGVTVTDRGTVKMTETEVASASLHIGG